MSRLWGHQATLASMIMLSIQATLVACATTAPPAAEPQAVADTWERHKGACEQILTAPASYPTDDIARCTRVWESHRQVGDLSLDVRSLYAVAFSQLWYQARDDYDREIATTALARLCVPRHPLDDQGHVEEVVPSTLQCGVAEPGATPSAPASNETPFAAERARLEPTRATRPHRVDELPRAARKQLQRARDRARDQRHGAAAELYAEVLDAHPHHLAARYGLAVALAHLGDDTAALTELEHLYTYDSLEVLDHLRAARTELAFERLRTDLAFKVMTGHRRVIVANAAHELGLPHVTEIVQHVEQRDLELYATVGERHLRLEPVVFYRPGLDQEAAQLIQELALPRNTEQGPIDFESLGDPDFIVIWGQPEALNNEEILPPEVQGIPAAGDKRDATDVLDPLEDATDDANKLRKAGEGIGDIVPH